MTRQPWPGGGPWNSSVIPKPWTVGWVKPSAPGNTTPTEVGTLSCGSWPALNQILLLSFMGQGILWADCGIQGVIPWTKSWLPPAPAGNLNQAVFIYPKPPQNLILTTLTVHSVQIYRCFSMIDSEKSTFYCSQSSPWLHSLPWDRSASLHMTSIPGFWLDWGLNPILLIVLHFKFYWKQMLPDQVEELTGIWSSIKCWLGVDEVFVIKRKQKQTSCLESPEGKEGAAFKKSFTAASCQARK